MKISVLTTSFLASFIMRCHVSEVEFQDMSFVAGLRNWWGQKRYIIRFNEGVWKLRKIV